MSSSSAHPRSCKANHVSNGGVNPASGDASPQDPNPQNHGVHMEKRVGLIGGMTLIIGTMIGSGIFISPQGVIRGTGSVGLSLLVWILCGLLSTLGSLSYAEIGTMISKSGGEYHYFLETFGPRNPTYGPIPAFLFSWVSILIIRPASMAIVSLSFGIYTAERFYTECPTPEILTKLFAILCIAIVCFMNCMSVKLAMRVQAVFTVAKLVAMGVIIVGGIVKIVQGNLDYLQEGFQDTSSSPSRIALAFYDGLWAYDGWNSLNFVTEELVNPTVNLPRALYTGLPIVTILYFLTNISYLTVISKEELLVTDAVATLWGERVLGVAAIIIPISVILSTFGSANGTLFSSGRLAYVAAREGHTIGFLSYIDIRRLTPTPSLILTGIIACAMIIMGNVSSLIDFFSFLSWLFYGMTMLCLIILRYTHSHVHRPYKVPLIIPIIVLIMSIFLIVAPIVQNPRMEFLYAILFTLSGIVFYVPFVVYKVKPRFMDSVTKVLQIVMAVAPTKEDEDSSS